MRRLVALALCLALLAPARAGADASTSSTAKVAPTSAVTLALTPVITKVGGKTGVWLPSDQMGRVVLRLESADKLEGLVSAQDTLISAQKRQIETTSKAIDLTAQLATEQKLRGDDFKNLAEKEGKQIEELSAWYRSPLLWTAVGAVGVTILGALLLGLRGSSPTINVQR